LGLVAATVGGQNYPTGNCADIAGFKKFQIVAGTRVFCNYKVRRVPTVCARYPIENHALIGAQHSDGGFTCTWQVQGPFGTPPHP
jgi:hypothetical protein